MFGSNPFGQPSSSPFGAQPAFGQQNTATNNPFAARPFGSTSPFGAQTGSTLFGGNSTGVFGTTPNPSPLATSTPAFGAPSTPAFGAPSTPTFAASSTPSFGSTPAFGASSTPAFGASSTPAFGASSTPAFGASPASAFGSGSSQFGATSAFGQKPAFGAFGSPNPAQSSAFGSTFGQPAFGSTSTPSFGFSNNSSFSQSTNAFGAASTPAFGNSPSAFGQKPAFGAFGSPNPAQSLLEVRLVNQLLVLHQLLHLDSATIHRFLNQLILLGLHQLQHLGTAHQHLEFSLPLLHLAAQVLGKHHLVDSVVVTRVTPYTTTNEADSGGSVSGQTTTNWTLGS